jgi:hypothetical protein
MSEVVSGGTYDSHSVITEADAVIPRATIEKSRVVFDADLSRFLGPCVALGNRGCFHEGCDAAEGEEGGSHWCMWVT